MWQRYARAERFTAEEVSARARWRACCRLGGGAMQLDTTAASTLLRKSEVGAAGWIPDVCCCGDDGHMMRQFDGLQRCGELAAHAADTRSTAKRGR